MSRQFIADLQARDSVDEIYRVADKQVRSNRQGNDYLLLQLMDRTGQVSGLRWNAGQSLYETFQKGDFLRILGTTQLHNGLLQIIVQDFETVHPSKVNHQDFTNSDPQEIEQLLAELKERLGRVKNPHLKRLMASYLADEQLLEKLAAHRLALRPTMHTRAVCCGTCWTSCELPRQLPRITHN